MAENLIHRLLPHQGCVIVDGEVRYDGQGDYSGIESTPSVGPCFGSAISIREFSITPLT
jgi:hypothetical protein